MPVRVLVMRTLGVFAAWMSLLAPVSLLAQAMRGEPLLEGIAWILPVAAVLTGIAAADLHAEWWRSPAGRRERRRREIKMLRRMYGDQPPQDAR
ncbi:hypothetical protein [Actinomadura sp. WAC 06369]|uniref:hypothetical protein n=1 Tax=Actinomadura sp. WAC 06369 TaxID=2203193 RepID=UPI000F7774EA|nr:hypothetical protein [Actinomadura sp. WAC 06369]RSN51127.1 hypothetical protein DMH08_31370 [Actinomadura sp. WAC 06369]